MLITLFFLVYLDFLGNWGLLWGVAGFGRYAVIGLAVAVGIICPSSSSFLHLLLCKLKYDLNTIKNKSDFPERH